MAKHRLTIDRNVENALARRGPKNFGELERNLRGSCR
jgi:hypothetical protein